jgi:chromate transporter
MRRITSLAFVAVTLFGAVLRAASFVLIALSGPLVPRLRRSRLASAFLDGVNVSALPLMTAVTAQLGKTALVDGYSIAVVLTGAGLLLRYKINAVWLIGAGAVSGLFVQRALS